MADDVLTVGSLFSGIGGIDLGLERAGMRVIWQSEIEPYASRVLAKHWPTVPNLGDITKIEWSTVEHPDVVAGGFPCQPVSAAGRQAGQADPRWLWPEFARCLRELRPRYVLVENVPALFTVASGGAAQEVFGDLALLGYDTEWGRLSAAELGAPHLRRRVFIVAHAIGVGAPLEQGWSGHERPAGVLASREDSLLAGGDGEDGVVADTDQERWDGRSWVFGTTGRLEPEDGRFWAVEPDVGRVADGIPARLDRLRCLGNAVVPQVAEWVGSQIVAMDAAVREDVA